MFLWLPLLFLIPFGFMWMMRSDAGGAGCCGMNHASPVAPQGSAGGPEPIEILRLRLARGEITSAEYEEIRRALG
jgi:uncharacterized membrane protein